MKYLVITEKADVVSGFQAMEVESVLVHSDKEALDAVCDALNSRTVGTLVLSKHVKEVSESVLEKHRESGRLPFVMTLLS
ncbi:MAG: V-type ATP synthase subunit F [Spirochaetales bacterium]